MHTCYGDQLGLTSDDEDYIDPYGDQVNNSKLSADSVSEVCIDKLIKTHPNQKINLLNCSKSKVLVKVN